MWRLSVALLGAVISLASVGQAEGESKAQKLVFGTPHMANLKSPSRVVYHYRSILKDKKPRVDELRLTYDTVAKKTTRLETRDDSVDIRSLRSLGGEGVEGSNLAIEMFAKATAITLSKQIGGAPGFHLAQFKRELAETTPTRTTLLHLGEVYQGYNIAFQPYQEEDMAKIDRMNEEKSGKKLPPEQTLVVLTKPLRKHNYSITLAKDLPGGLYYMGAATPSADNQTVILTRRDLLANGVDAVGGKK